MRSIEIKRQMDAAGMDDVSELIEAAWRADGARPLNDHLWLDLREGGRHGFAGIIATDDTHSHIIAYCQVSRGNESWSLDLIVHPHNRYDTLEIAPDLLQEAMNIVAHEGGGHVHWWVFEPNNLHSQLAARVGLRPGRRLLQMRRSLPLTTDEMAMVNDFHTSSFRVGVDEDAWLVVNNAAFAQHPEQGGWTRDTMHAREREQWFDADGFRMRWVNDELAGFCWTKTHLDTNPAMGEIYVIAMNPAFAGHGEGRKMTLAGLQYLSDKGLTVGMLYVDADNAPAISVYTSLGFIAHHNEVAFVGDISSQVQQ